MDRACELWHEAYDIHPQGYAIPYLLGVCAEMAGDLDKALKYYQKADRMTGKPVEEISQALGRIRVRMKKEKRLEQQLQR
ncbi:MAG: tetratricopeptide repeat protein [Deltaproteobacteria bacterium]|nr:tetratricopeptide repeat protein [Deltaproteobacteria bacterium]